MLQVKNVRKAFGDNQVLRGVDMEVRKGDIVVILGPSGSGKTTFLRCLNFLEQADSGTMDFDEVHTELKSASKAVISKVRKKTAFVFQNYNLVPILSVGENITLPLKLDGVSPDTAYLRHVIQSLKIEDKLDAMPHMLSGGQQQRVAIARALSMKPALILADEPTGSLDSVTGIEVVGLLKASAQAFNQTIVVVTHNEEIAQLADRIIRIEDGRVGGGKDEE